MQKSEQVNIAVIGAGSWGSALAFALARNNHSISLLKIILRLFGRPKALIKATTKVAQCY